MKEILFDMAEATKNQFKDIEMQLVDFGVVGLGPRRCLNFIANRRWFDNGCGGQTHVLVIP